METCVTTGAAARTTEETSKTRTQGEALVVWDVDIPRSSRSCDPSSSVVRTAHDPMHAALLKQRHKTPLSSSSVVLVFPQQAWTTFIFWD
jgi:hypothetical protein